MKKRTLLSFAAATAICAASAGSYAAWDNVTADSTGSIKVASRIDVKGKGMGEFEQTYSLSAVPFYDANATFDLSSVVDTKMQDKMGFQLSISVKNSGLDVDKSAYKVSVVPKDGTEIQVTNDVYLDIAPTFEKDGAIYGIKVTLEDTAEGKALAEATLDVVVTGLLVEKVI